MKTGLIITITIIVVGLIANYFYTAYANRKAADRREEEALEEAREAKEREAAAISEAKAARAREKQKAYRKRKKAKKLEEAKKVDTETIVVKTPAKRGRKPKISK